MNYDKIILSFKVEGNRTGHKEGHFIWDSPELVHDFLLKNNWVCLIVMLEKEINPGY